MRHIHHPVQSLGQPGVVRMILRPGKDGFTEVVRSWTDGGQSFQFVTDLLLLLASEKSSTRRSDLGMLGTGSALIFS